MQDGACLASRVLPNLWSCCRSVNVSIGWVFKLLQDVRILGLGSNLLCLCYCTLHSLQVNLQLVNGKLLNSSHSTVKARSCVYSVTLEKLSYRMLGDKISRQSHLGWVC